VRTNARAGEFTLTPSDLDQLDEICPPGRR